ncbi:MAG: hypothetical protein ACREOC_01515 [Gemmatimonadales bacterium]
MALIGWPGLAAGQLPAAVPPEPEQDADLATLGAWIERWLPVVGAASYQTVDQTGDFFAYASDSVTSALLEGCTLVLHERFVSTVRGETLERRQAVRVPLDQLDTNVVWPRIRRAQMLLTSPNVLVRGQLVVPLRNPSRTRFITVSPQGEPHQDTLVAEHLVPLLFADVPARRSAFAIRRAAAYCIRSRYRGRLRVRSGGAMTRGARSTSPR